MCTFSCDGHHGGNDEKPAKPLPASVSKLPALPTGARLADSFLTTLVRLCRLEELPLTVLARVGYRTTGAAADVDGTDEVRHVYEEANRGGEGPGGGEGRSNC